MNTEWGKLTIQVRMMVNVLGLMHVLLGLVVIWGGPVRFPAPTYSPLTDFVHHRVWVYGLVFIIAGSLMLAHRVGGVVVGLVVGWLSMNLWAALFLYAAVKFPNAGATATIAYGGYALLDAIFMVKVYLYRREFRNRG